MLKFIKHNSKYIVSLSIVALLSACGSNDNEGANNVEDGSSQLISATVIDEVNASTMLTIIKAKIDANVKNAFAYKAVKITYNTVGQDNKLVVASGLLVIPTPTDAHKAYLSSVGKPFSVSMINENHGTIFLNSEAPTQKEVHNGVPDYATAILMTGVAGFASVVPDYIGFGDSNSSVLPYILEKSAARSSVDMIKASMKYMEDSGVVLNHQLYISGYSQGGYNAMAVAKSVEAGALPNVNLMGVAPMAGPYNVEDLGNIELNATHTMAYPAFLADLAYSYATYYDDINISDIAIPSLAQFQLAFNGSNDTVPIHITLGVGAIDINGTVTDYGFYTHKANELFKDSFILAYQNNQNNIMRQKFVENNLDNWTPSGKMNLIQCLEDEIIPFSESNNTYNKFKANGANVTLTGIPTSILKQQKDATHPFIHANCGREAYGVAVQWFDAIRQGKI